MTHTYGIVSECRLVENIIKFIKGLPDEAAGTMKANILASNFLQDI